MEKMRDIKRIRHTENTHQNDKSKLYVINSNFKCKWIKLPHQKAKTGRMDLKIWFNYVLSTRDLF